MITLAADNPRLAMLHNAHSKACQFRRWATMFDQAAILAAPTNPDHARVLYARARECRHAAAIRDVVSCSPEREQEARIRAMEQIYHGGEL